ncbi:MOG interacting and ectopic P-granules protein 1 isoform X2 [Anthonomus grandis grandis]|uniref:MOG interacting and ectopic P-granules protein 1 isoform X2 n=1 Tax=Anthonomus grandis grandis TaxID=2921223 RepID=UPI0021655334|nr:MOG interacting and ectopic P-granules protein 1 isoform X2 [Anthonomus grandis grandis]
MAEVAQMGEVDEIHSNEEGIIVNGDVTKELESESGDVEMADDQDVNSEHLVVNKTVAGVNSEEGVKDVEMEDVTSQSAADEDSQDSQDSQGSQTSHTSQDEAKSVASPEQEDSNLEPGEVIPEENGSVHSANEDTNTNSSLPQQVNENSRGSDKNDDESSSSSSSTAESTTSKTQEEPAGESKSSENTQDSSATTNGETDDKSSQDGATAPPTTNTKPEDSKTDETSENGDENRSASVASSQEIHEINDDDDDDNDNKSEKGKSQELIELNSEDEEEQEEEEEGDGDVLIVEGPKTNGTEVINLDDTPEKKSTASGEGEKKKIEAVAPRRSTRNLNKSKSYNECEKDPPPPKTVESEGSDIEEVLPQDPLAVNDQITVEKIPMVKKTVKNPENSSAIVVKDTKRLVEIANKSSPTQQPGKKEPTLVIIDTNSILSGRGPVPASKQSSQIGATGFANVLPVAVPAQGLYPANMRATITPIPAAASGTVKASPIITASLQPGSTAASAAPLLPTLTDDMFVVEAPSFIVPYVYEKPPVKILKDFVTDIKKQIQDTKKEKKPAKGKDEPADKKDDDKKKQDEDSDVTISSESESDDEKEPERKKPYSYFESPLGKFFMDIGFNMVQGYVQTDLLKQQRRKRDREQGANPETNKTIASLMKNIELSKGKSEPFKMEMKKCEFCSFKTESKLAMAYHLETPHMKNFVYKCNFCSYEVRSPHDILFHMEAEHAVRGHLERAPAFHQCPSCPFEDNQKGKLSRHMVVCARKFKPERNLDPPVDWEPPAKIPRLPKMRASGLNATVAAYQTLAANKSAQQYQFLSKMQLQANAAAATALNRGRGRPALGTAPIKTQATMIRPQGMIFKQQPGGGQVLVPANYQLAGNQVYQVVGGTTELGGRLGAVPSMAFLPSSAQAPSGSHQSGGGQGGAQGQTAAASKKPANTPSISITPLPRGTTGSPAGTAATAAGSKPGDTSSKNSFVICEICDGYIKDLEQLRNHMQWIHKIKIHPKMIYNRPPLNCQKCQFRFFTDQGLERHLLGSHGLVTSSMQDAANKSKDSGRCPVCGRVYQWKLLNHVARDHNMTLKPAHLSYKCTVCTATFGMYKQFENHVYSAHSVVAKRVMDKKTTSAGASPSAAKSTEIKPLKINDEITIIPQPAKSTNGAKEASPAPKAAAGTSKSR